MEGKRTHFPPPVWSCWKAPFIASGTSMLRIAVIVCGILLGLLVAAILIAGGHSHVLAGLRHVAADPWGVVTLLDLGVGLLFVAVWLALVEPSPWRAAVWIIALFLLGNVVTLTYLLWRTCQVRHWSELFLPSRSSDWR
ncbi:MAG: DUF1475 domain-containing protein [Candidatus Contendobacter sp.]|nr:MAG: DUF1475 domain-containing protein [Candidatus Contendobacter sp.]